MNQSIILTVHNKDWLIERVIRAIYAMTEGSYELIIVLDGCTDNSEKVILDVLQDLTDIDGKIIFTPDVYETMANNAALKVATGDQVIIVQDDMIINEPAWNQRLSAPLLAFSDVFAVTAKTAHNFKLNQSSRHINMQENLDNCWCAILNYDSVINRGNGLSRDTFAIRHSVNRGPLLLDHAKLEKLGYFDETFAPQNMDDHDLCYRAYKEHGWVAGAYWIDFINEDEWSSTKTHDVSQVPAWLFNAHHKNTKIVWERHQDIITKGNHNEDRRISI